MIWLAFSITFVGILVAAAIVGIGNITINVHHKKMPDYVKPEIKRHSVTMDVESRGPFVPGPIPQAPPIRKVREGGRE